MHVRRSPQGPDAFLGRSRREARLVDDLLSDALPEIGADGLDVGWYLVAALAARNGPVSSGAVLGVNAP